jgi:UDPglucose 6-dehydrogenase
MKIAVIGTGYVGLVSGACFAEFGHEVTCVDKDEAKIGRLKKGEMPIYEDGLAEMVDGNARDGRLSFTCDTAAAAAGARVVFLAVGTPPRQSDGHADLTHLFQAVHEIAPHLPDGAVVVTKSTVPVGTGDEVERILLASRPDASFAVVSNPEFLREGSAIGDFRHPDRIVVGTDDPRAREVMAELYRPIARDDVPLLFTSRRTAELIKYAANAFLVTKITYINEMADLCESVGANVEEVARGIGLDQRIGSRFLNAGPGYGGSCFPKDTLALIKTAHDAGVSLRLVETVVAVNEQRKRQMARKVLQACGGSARDKRLAVLGLTFKPNTDDTRESPALAVIGALRDHGASITAYDPEGMPQAQRLLDGVNFSEDPYSCIKGADALVVLTEWDVFRGLDLQRVRSLLKTPVVVDLRNIYPPKEMARLGFLYYSIGRPETDLSLEYQSAAE